MLQPRAGGRLGRFELKRELGRGAQAVVWLAHDPFLQRDVALKVLDTTHSDAAERDHWLHEARAVSALSHPHIVPVFEAVDAAGGSGRPYLVFEYVEGPTLAQARRTRGAWPQREAATLMLGVLDALAAAHAVGLVHRDLKPSNVLIGSDGRPRVMDFGIAARVPGANGGARAGVRASATPAATGGEIVGSPGYISPEAARGEAPSAAMDVFAAGVIFGELLAGDALLKERDPWRALERVRLEDLQLPASTRVDEPLRGIVLRALARDPANRYDSARAMHAALSAWLAPDAAADAAPAGDNGHSTLEFLLRRMRHKTDFPALSDSVLRIQRLAASETARLTHLADEVLTDVALTNKLLRMVNSVHFASAGSGQIATVSRAVALVGFAGVRNMAMAVLLLEHMKDKGQADLLRQEFLRALTAGALAAELEPRARESEEAFLASMLQNLGRLLAEFYFPEEAERIRQMAAARNAGAVANTQSAAPSSHACAGAHEAAALHVLGLTLDELGAGVARAWGLPEGLQKAMRRPDGDVPRRGVDDRVDRQRWLGHAAGALADTLMEQGSEALNDALERVAGRYAAALEITPQAARQATHAARERVSTLASAMGIAVPKRGPARRLLLAEPAAAGAPRAAPAPVAARAARAAVADAPAAIDAIDRVADAPIIARTPDAACAAPCIAALADGRSRIEQGLAERRLKLNDVLQLVLSTLQQALSCRNVVFCLRDARDARAQRLRGRLAVGPLAADVFEVHPAQQGDLLAVVTARAVDTLIADAGTVAARMPAWWRQQVRAGTFLLLPLAVKGVTLGLIYADRAEAGSLSPSEAELAEVRSLRDAVVGAFASGLR